MTMERLEKLKDEGTVLEGVVRLIQFDQDLDTDIAQVEYDGHSVTIKREDLEVKPVKGSLVDYVGSNISFQITDIDEEGNVFGSSKKIKEEMLDALAKEMEDGKVKTARVTKILNYGAYLEVNGLSVQMLNKDFSEDYTTIRDVLKEGDTIDVVFERYTQSRNLRVRAKEKHESKTDMSFDKLQPHQVVLGVVRNVQPWAAYVGIAPNLDAMCPVPPNMQIDEGDKVQFKITQVRTEEKRVRGKIIKKITQ